MRIWPSWGWSWRSWVSLCFALLVSSSPCGAATTSKAAEPPRPLDLVRLRTVICAMETLGTADPEDAVGANGELGRCQVKWWTARMLGYKGTRVALITNRGLNEQWAFNVLADCRMRLPRAGVKRLAFCYTAGRYARPYGSDARKIAYSEKAARIYRERQ